MFSQNFTPLTLDDNVLKKFDAHHLKNFDFTTEYRPKLHRDVVKRNLEMLNDDEKRFFN